MNEKLIETVGSLMVDYPRGSQELAEDPILAAKLLSGCSAATWFLMEYDPETTQAFGYVLGQGQDEWRYFCLEELASLLASADVYALEIDTQYRPQRASELGLPR